MTRARLVLLIRLTTLAAVCWLAVVYFGPLALIPVALFMPPSLLDSGVDPTTPGGGCSCCTTSLPDTLVLRISGLTGGCSIYNETLMLHGSGTCAGLWGDTTSGFAVGNGITHPTYCRFAVSLTRAGCVGIYAVEFPVDSMTCEAALAAMVFEFGGSCCNWSTATVTVGTS